MQQRRRCTSPKSVGYGYEAASMCEDMYGKTFVLKSTVGSIHCAELLYFKWVSPNPHPHHKENQGKTFITFFLLCGPFQSPSNMYGSAYRYRRIKICGPFLSPSNMYCSAYRYRRIKKEVLSVPTDNKEASGESSTARCIERTLT